jgi:lipopolysaccharide export system permease protein
LFILWRYILKEHVGPFLFAISVITLVFLLNLVFRELGRILSRGLAFGLVLEFFFLNMAWIIALAVPMAVLVATLMAFGRLSGDSEITAMKAGGVGIPQLILPVFLVSILLGFFLIWFNNEVLPEFNHRARLLTSDIARKRPTLSIEPGVINRDLDNYNILVQQMDEKPDTSHVSGVFIEDNKDQNKSKIIFADRGKIWLNESKGVLVITLYDGEMHEFDLKEMEEYIKLDFPKHVLTISVPNLVLERSDSEYRTDREKSAQMMSAEVVENEKEITARREKIASLIGDHFGKYLQDDTPIVTDARGIRRTLAFAAGGTQNNRIKRIRDSHRRLKQQLLAETSIIDNMQRANYVLMVEVHKKYSIPMACIIFVLVGAPLGIMARRGNLAVAGGISFGFFLLYWASLIAGEELADNQIITPMVAMWIANVIVGAGGIYLIIHSIHEATFINWISIGLFFKKLFRRGEFSRAGGSL